MSAPTHTGVVGGHTVAHHGLIGTVDVDEDGGAEGEDRPVPLDVSMTQGPSAPKRVCVYEVV